MKTPVKRKIVLIDSSLQSRLLFAFLLLEMLLIGGGMIVMHLELKDVVEENLFRIHLAISESLSSLLIWKAMRILAMLAILNVVALGLAKWLWVQHLKSILKPLSELLSRTARLDFKADNVVGHHHAVLANTLAWRECERQRCMAIRAALSGLDENACNSSTTALEKTRVALEKIKTLLPENQR